MIKIAYENIDLAINALTNWLGAPTTINNGRVIGLGAITKAKWTGPGWLLYTDHKRTSTHGTIVEAFLTFDNSKNETIWRLKHPELCG